MARPRSTTPATPTNHDTRLQLRLHDRTRTDWMSDAAGWLLLYDPAIITAKEFDRLFGLQQVAASALGWMVGLQNGFPLVAAPEHWGGGNRADVAERLAHLVRLGWLQAVTVLPLCVASNGADVQVRRDGLTGEERKRHTAYHRAKTRGRIMEPHQTWITATQDRLAFTWDVMLGFTAAQKKRTFDAGHTVEFAWPTGSYHVKAWSFESVDDGDGMWVDQFVVQLNHTPSR